MCRLIDLQAVAHEAASLMRHSPDFLALKNTYNSTIKVIIEQLPLQSPEQEIALLQQAGFEGVELFYAGFSFKGWVAYAS